MSRKKKYIGIGTAVLALGILATMGFTMAGSGFAGPWAHAGLFRHGCPGKFGGHFMKAMILSHVDDMAETLALTEDQNGKFEEIRDQLENNIDLGREKRRAFFDTMKAEINSPEPDMTALVGMAKGKINEIPNHVSANLDLFLDFCNILDENQKAQLVDMFRDRFEKCES
ncbi:MAG: Spy/CpxP family protein refolding chaperone [Deltaproteobacteria bacterium]|nr:Spy/CpxP family protein refolding chaperone [Deltaproteobacteria bacterium]MBW1816677.1 Spy/CpxP family protein refolding chaperone [Deltaproteobacteria bacterium]